MSSPVEIFVQLGFVHLTAAVALLGPIEHTPGSVTVTEAMAPFPSTVYVAAGCASHCPPEKTTFPPPAV